MCFIILSYIVYFIQPGVIVVYSVSDEISFLFFLIENNKTKRVNKISNKINVKASTYYTYTSLPTLCPHPPIFRPLLHFIPGSAKSLLYNLEAKNVSVSQRFRENCYLSKQDIANVSFII